MTAITCVFAVEDLVFLGCFRDGKNLDAQTRPTQAILTTTIWLDQTLLSEILLCCAWSSTTSSGKKYFSIYREALR